VVSASLPPVLIAVSLVMIAIILMVGISIVRGPRDI
jgi:hypothetical protein